MRFLLPFAIFACPLAAAVTTADYSHAEQFLAYNTNPLVYGAGVRPTFVAGTDSFWYRVNRESGVEFMLVDPARKTRIPAFDHAKIAAVLKVEPGKLPFQTIDLTPDLKTLSFSVGTKHWTCSLDSYKCSPAETPSQTPTFIPSPDKKKTAFLRDYNLWVRDADTKAETQLTTDGVKDFGYATDNAGWVKSERPILLWSPDSKKIATFQQDQRGVGEMYLVNTVVGHPKLEAWKYPLPGDAVVPTIQRVVIDVNAKTVTRLKIEPDQHRSTLCDHIICRGGEWADVQWSPDGQKLAFVSSSRDHKQARLREADVTTGEVREVNEEAVPTQYESGDGKVNWQVLYGSNEYLWYSEKSGWGHSYLGNWKTGKLQSQITTGDWLVRQVLRVDEKERVMYFLGRRQRKGP